MQMTGLCAGAATLEQNDAEPAAVPRRFMPFNAANCLENTSEPRTLGFLNIRETEGWCGIEFLGSQIAVHALAPPYILYHWMLFD